MNDNHKLNCKYKYHLTQRLNTEVTIVCSENFLLRMETEVAETPITTVETVITTNEDLPSGHETEIDSEVIDTETFTQVAPL